jgi:hypothetical protein
MDQENIMIDQQKTMKIIFLILVLFAFCPSWAQTNPFTESEILINQDSSGNRVKLKTEQANNNSADMLRQAFRKLAQTQENFAKLLNSIATNPMKFMENGSLGKIFSKVAELQKRLSAAAEKLLDMAKNSGISMEELTSSGNTSNTGSNPSNTKLTPPPPKTSSASGGISSKSPEFSQWLSAGTNIAKSWNFPDITNMYGEKVTRENFLKTIIFIESSGIHKKSSGQIVTSSCGALGFMQLMPNTAKGLGVNPRDPAQNIKGGSKYFNTIFNKGTVGSKSGIDKLVMAGCAYNMGPYSSKLKQSWSSFLSSSNVSKGPKMYGLKIKMCLGIKLNQAEKSFVKNNMARGRSVDDYAKSLYSYAHGIGGR